MRADQTWEQRMHEAARKGFAAQSAAYERGRPEYPAELAGWLRDVLGVRSGHRVLDLGAGTGKFTKRLLALQAEVVAVEPVAAMRERLQTALPGVRALAGTAEALPLPDGSVDAVVCAQAFHWFANGQALREMHRVLRPGGRLGLVWNVRDARVDWVAAITALITPYEGDAPRHHSGRWREPFAEQSLFGPLQLDHFDHAHEGGFDEVVMDRFRSVSFIAAQAEPVRRETEAALRRLPEQYAALRAPCIRFPYRTEAWWAERLA